LELEDGNQDRLPWLCPRCLSKHLARLENY
jgi:hypothetical protein